MDEQSEGKRIACSVQKAEAKADCKTIIHRKAKLRKELEFLELMRAATQNVRNIAIICLKKEPSIKYNCNVLQRTFKNIHSPYIQ